MTITGRYQNTNALTDTLEELFIFSDEPETFKENKELRIKVNEQTLIVYTLDDIRIGTAKRANNHYIVKSLDRKYNNLVV